MYSGARSVKRSMSKMTKTTLSRRRSVPNVHSQLATLYFRQSRRTAPSFFLWSASNVTALVFNRLANPAHGLDIPATQTMSCHAAYANHRMSGSGQVRSRARNAGPQSMSARIRSNSSTEYDCAKPTTTQSSHNYDETVLGAEAPTSVPHPSPPNRRPHPILPSRPPLRHASLSNSLAFRGSPE